jgi:serine/threonine-protein kinase
MVSGTDILPARYADPRLIASGGMGRIFRATDRELRREVAVKVLADRYADDAGVRARFQREALAAARLSSHPNIVTIYDIAECNGRPMIVMQYLEGGSLEARVEGHGGCPPGQVLDWMEQAARALDAAHAAGVVHRDIKPGNLLLDGNDQLHVGDFGIASAVGLHSLTEAGTILGTAGYLSPEQARGERATAASDRYSLAVVAFELLAGRRPFESASTTAEATRHANAPVPSIHDLKAELPPTFDPVFKRALAKDPAARYASAAELVAALRGALAQDAGTTAWVVPAHAGPPTAVTEVTRRPPPPPAYAASRGTRSRWLLPLLLAVLLAAGVAAAYAATRGGKAHRNAARRHPVTVVHTVTTPGRTLEKTVTAPAPPPVTEQATTAAPPATTQAVSGASGTTLANEGYAKMQAGDYNGALPLLEQAVQQLGGTGSLAEAYADYNLAYTRYALGQCTGVLSLLDASQAIQGHRTEIDRLRGEAKKACG